MKTHDAINESVVTVCFISFVEWWMQSVSCAQQRHKHAADWRKRCFYDFFGQPGVVITLLWRLRDDGCDIKPVELLSGDAWCLWDCSSAQTRASRLCFCVLVAPELGLPPSVDREVAAAVAAVTARWLAARSVPPEEITPFIVNGVPRGCFPGSHSRSM